MRTTIPNAIAPAVVMAAWIAAGPALATESAVDAATPSADACRKTVHAMGASMGEAEQKAAEWGLAYFVVRTNGVDYDVLCDAKTGVVKDVARRTEPGIGAE